MDTVTRLKTKYPLVWQNLSATLETRNAQEQQDLLLLYAHLDCHDIPSVTPEEMLGYVRASQKARERLPYANQVPAELYGAFVLAPRVNNEWPDGSREWLLDALHPRVNQLDMMDAALEVNYWCYEQATYRSTDDRTVGPFGICRRGFGRCGEESTLLVCALRAVGIPARQVYAPCWAHCDDNHAWVEFWADGDWHYMGACEPEPIPDQGWFRAAASRAMLIRSRVLAPEDAEGCRVVNTTSRYAKTARLQVRVTHHGTPVAGAEVRFQLINYSRIQPLHAAKTDENGIVTLETGLGSLLVSTCVDGIYAEKLVTLPGVSDAELRLGEGIDPGTAETESRYTFHVPREIIPVPQPENEAHQKRLRCCESIREEAARTGGECSEWMEKARGNRAEIAAFLALEGYAADDKELLLRTLSDKDFCDCTCSVLESFLAEALRWKDQQPLLLWQREILAPRVENEPLLNIRPALYSQLSGYCLSTRQQVLDWMERNLRREPEYGLTDRRGNAAGYVANRCCPASEWDILAVQICRALGISAALDVQTKKLSAGQEQPRVALTLRALGQPMTEEEHFSLSRWTGEGYEPIHLGCGAVAGDYAVSLAPGSYCLTVVRRQIDGCVDAIVQRFPLREDRICFLTSPPDHTAEKLLAEPLPRIALSALTENAAEVSALCEKRPSLLAFLEPGKEPTEHLLQEILALTGDYAAAHVPVRFLLNDPKGLTDPALTAVLHQLPNCAAYTYRRADRYQVQRAAKIGDFRLPLALAVDSSQRIRYGFANYNIRTAATLLHILKLSD